jgi:hypothetical protein
MKQNLLLSSQVGNILLRCRKTLERFGEFPKNRDNFWGKNGRVGGQCCIGAVRVYQKIKHLLPNIKIAWNERHCFNLVIINDVRHIVDITATQFNCIIESPKILISPYKNIEGRYCCCGQDFYKIEEVFNDELLFYNFLKNSGWPSSQMPVIKRNPQYVSGTFR